MILTNTTKLNRKETRALKKEMLDNRHEFLSVIVDDLYLIAAAIEDQQFKRKFDGTLLKTSNLRAKARRRLKQLTLLEIDYLSKTNSVFIHSMNVIGC